MRRADREVSDTKAIEKILLKCKTCHVAMIDGTMPYVIPLSYGYKFTDSDSLELYFHSATEGKKLDILKSNNNVCFAISDEGEFINSESACGMGYYYSSVIGCGEVFFLADAAEKCEGLSVIVQHQSGSSVEFTEKQAESVCVYKIVSKDFTGKQKRAG